MIGIIIELLISWLLLKYVQHENLNVLGLAPGRRRLFDLLSGLLLPLVYVCVFEFAVAAVVHNPYKLHPGYRPVDFGHACWYLLKSVAYEDLLFRGALLYILMQKIGMQKAMLISAVAFGIYHWFAWGALGNPAAMVIIFLMTGSAGYIYALAFERTSSMYLGAGLHFGIDFATSVLFSQDKSIGQQLLVKTFSKDPVSPASWIAILVIIVHFIGFPALSFWWLKRKKRTNGEPAGHFYEID
ncbi:MAG TPA: CPBP family intramembrane glutamic endopeptidase [Mucilaginibacter sp.]|jgi:membrane protease YdiL (CAAX protease family)|nr:CPBP family intramembrane glutamic endopeptidase [Mucilaginibacter sp.]